MSQLLGDAVPTAGLITRDDKRVYANAYADREREAIITPDGMGDYSNDLWPRSTLDASGGDVMAVSPVASRAWLMPEVTDGRKGGLTFIGVARDAFNTPISGATVRLFRTSDFSLQDTYTSDVNGNFQLYTIYSDAHYILAYKAGSPDVEGTTVNTLVGA